MYFSLAIPLITALLASTISARSVPPNVRAFFNAHRGPCRNQLGIEKGGFAYCGDKPGVIFLKGSGGQYDNMDIDCDGINRSAGKCGNDRSGQGQTSFGSLVRGVSNGAAKELDANLVPYVVFGNQDARPSFDPQRFGMRPLSVMAVVCGDRLIYGIWGDTNGGTLTGEASISLAELCFPNEGISGDNGHEANDVLYIGFTTGDAVDAARYNWRAKSAADFERSITALGDKLIARL
ncbi:MAG: hypothetical protein M1839_006406 [Geoglossum umbratile]|nr:MAG: hypothetical protein M1839_006406 [Geoglossum umbratile]